MHLHNEVIHYNNYLDILYLQFLSQIVKGLLLYFFDVLRDMIDKV